MLAPSSLRGSLPSPSFTLPVPCPRPHLHANLMLGPQTFWCSPGAPENGQAWALAADMACEERGGPR